MLVVQTGVSQEDFVCLVFFHLQSQVSHENGTFKVFHLPPTTLIYEPEGRGSKVLYIIHISTTTYFKALLTTQQISCSTVREAWGGGIVVGHPVCVRTVLCVT